jgi:hypothetical protein
MRNEQLSGTLPWWMQGVMSGCGATPSQQIYLGDEGFVARMQALIEPHRRADVDVPRVQRRRAEPLAHRLATEPSMEAALLRAYAAGATMTSPARELNISVSRVGRPIAGAETCGAPSRVDTSRTDRHGARAALRDGTGLQGAAAANHPSYVLQKPNGRSCAKGALGQEARPDPDCSRKTLIARPLVCQSYLTPVSPILSSFGSCGRRLQGVQLTVEHHGFEFLQRPRSANDIARLIRSI